MADRSSKSEANVVSQTGAGSSGPATAGSADAVVQSERSKAATRTESASPKRTSKVKKPAASASKAKSKGEKKAESAERKIRAVQQEMNDLKAELGSVLGHPFGQVRPEEPGVQEPVL